MSSSATLIKGSLTVAPPSSSSPVVKVKLLEPWAKMPTRGEPGAAGWDVALFEPQKRDGNVTYFRTGIAVEPPVGVKLLLYPRSSLSKTDYWLANGVGVIDTSYRGEILVALRTYPNFQPQPLVPGKTYVQLVPEICLATQLNRSIKFAETQGELSQTIRGSGGFGSTDDVVVEKLH